MVAAKLIAVPVYSVRKDFSELTKSHPIVYTTFEDKCGYVFKCPMCAQNVMLETQGRHKQLQMEDHSSESISIRCTLYHQSCQWSGKIRNNTVQTIDAVSF